MAGNTITAKKIKLWERRQMALDMRTDGLSYRQIAARMEVETGKSYSASMAYRDVFAMYGRVQDGMDEEAKSALTLDLLRLDKLFGSWWVAAVNPTSEEEKYRKEKKQRESLLLQTLGLVYREVQELNNALDEGGGAGRAGDVLPLANAAKAIANELREESLLPSSSVPDSKAAKMILDIMARKAKLLGMDQKSVNITQDEPFEIGGDVGGMSEKQLDAMIANLTLIVASQ